MAVIYGLCDPETLVVRYVGQTKLTAEQRLAGHMETARSPKYQWRVYRWIRSLSCTPVVIILEDNPLSLDEAEIRWIAQLRAQGLDLCNLTAGGGGLANPTLETRMKMSESASKAIRPPFSQETRDKIAAAHKGKPKGPMSPEHKAKISAGGRGKQIGKYVSPLTRSRISAAVKARGPVSLMTRSRLSAASKASWERRKGNYY